ncbi:DEAD/DEAH box helicase [Actinopolymorpha sp. NPDC004070]|uniref:DEAD/DEAH box helicase n=1 Tax=Actinopolymorpha sp. NPDC004070 TaxID=3154548 RepID=UPI0033AFC3AA
MSGFDGLHPAVQYHVVNSLGWSSLRPLQEAAVSPVLGGEDALLLAPTAGGKTEAAMLPLLSRMAAGGWRGLSVLYVCPLRALVNNLEPRLSAMTAWLGRRAAVWHGDVPDSVRQRIAKDPPDVLLTTPESLEAMLMSARVDHQWLFGDLRTIVVDELHAFGGDDRGWHLLGVVSRLTRLAGRLVQRIGLSATVGNPDALLDWFAGDSAAVRRVVNPPVATSDVAPDVELDYVGSVQNAAYVIARLHQGEKRLVFCDSRTQVEDLAVALRYNGVQTFVSHSSLSAAERRQSEAGFAAAFNCVIVATSTLELGVDIGDLDRVIQIDAPSTVASFLQRMGRTGRRPGTTRNTLFLTTRQSALWQAASILLLWGRCYVEPVRPPVLPLHIIAQQILGLMLQERQVVHHDVWDWLDGLADVAGADKVLAHLVAEGFVVDDGGLLSIGPRAEQEYGRRHFLELTSAFTSEPLLQVLLGRQALGSLSALSLVARPEGGPRLVLLGGRSWLVRHVDWRRRQVFVEATDLRGRSRWNGGGRTMSYELARAHHDVVAGSSPGGVRLSRRAQDALGELREDHAFVSAGDRTYVVGDSSGVVQWWTFAGFAANSALAQGLGDLVDDAAAVGDLGLRLRSHVRVADLRSVLDDRREALLEAHPHVDEAALAGLKFSAAVPLKLARTALASRLEDKAGIHQVCTRLIGESHT